MIQELMSDIALLGDQLKQYEKLSNANSEKVDPLELLGLQCTIEETITRYSLLFQKMPKIQAVFEGLREYYTKEVIKRKGN